VGFSTACGSAERGADGSNSSVAEPSAIASAGPDSGRTATTVNEAPLTPLALLTSLENIGQELSKRQAAGTLSPSLAEAWQKAQPARSAPDVGQLIGLIRAAAPSATILQVSDETMARYFESYNAVLSELHAEAEQATLDDQLSALNQEWQAVTAQIEAADQSAQRSSTYCCAYRAWSISPNFHCFQFKTIGIWAAAKCSAFTAGVPLVDQILFQKTACSNLQECQ